MITDIPVLVALSQLRVRNKKRQQIRDENLCQMMLKLSVRQSRDYSWNDANVRDGVKTIGEEGEKK